MNPFYCAWEALQRYMDDTEALPDIPALEPYLGQWLCGQVFHCAHPVRPDPQGHYEDLTPWNLPESERIFLTLHQDRVAVIELRSSALPLFKDPVEALNVHSGNKSWKHELETNHYRAIQPLWTYGNPAQGWLRFYFEPCRTHTLGGRGGEHTRPGEVLLAKARLQAEELLIPAGALEQPLRLQVSSLLSPPDFDTPKPDEDSHYWTALEADA
jgi:hypothetical protein